MNPEVLEPSEQYKHRIEAILNTELTIANINTFADQALDELIVVNNEVVTSYNSVSDTRDLTPKETEEQAYRYYGLDDVDETLSHIMSVTDEIRDLDILIASSPQVDSVILPPDEYTAEMPVSTGTHSELLSKSIYPRTKTTLFILKHDYGINLDDRDQLKILHGQLPSEMARKKSYNLIEVPAIERTVLVNDETGNVTFVFDNEVLKLNGITASDLVSLTKSDLKDLIDDCPAIGITIKLTPEYADDIRTALGKIDVKESRERDRSSEKRQYLKAPRKSNLPEGYETEFGVSKALSIGRSVTARALKELGILEQDIYSPEDIDRVNAHIQKEDDFYPIAPDELKSSKGISIELGLDKKRVLKRVSEMAEELGLEKYRFGANGVPTWGLDAEAEKAVIASFETEDSQLDVIPDDYATCHTFSVKLGIHYATAERLLKSVEAEENEVLFGKSNTRPRLHYSLRIQEAAFTVLQQSRIKAVKERFSNKAYSDFLTIEE